jgi:hypothetical protein
MEESLSRGLQIYDFARKEVYEKRGSEEGFIPIFEWPRRICKKGKTNFNIVAMFAFGRPILLMSMIIRDMMGDTTFLKESMEFLIFTPPLPISLHSNYFPSKLALNILLKIKEHLINIITLFKQINPCELAKIINKAYIVCMFPNRERS